jgi:predicted neutral ceramidase superfamily lipid hydrolase
MGWRRADMLSVAGDIAGAGAALAGLTLVFLGATAAAYDTYQVTEQPAVIDRYRRRAWLAFAGFALSLVACSLALVGKWQADSYLVTSAAVALILAFLIVLVAAWQTVRGIS